MQLYIIESRALREFSDENIRKQTSSSSSGSITNTMTATNAEKEKIAADLKAASKRDRSRLWVTLCLVLLLC